MRTNGMGLFLVCWILFLMSALGVVYCKHEARRLFVVQESLRQNRDNLHSERTQLLLEQSTWAAHGRVDLIASHELKMIPPSAADARILRP